MALLGDTELNDIRGRLLDVEKILRGQDWGPDDSDGYTEALASLELFRRQVIDLSMYHSDPTPEDDGQRTADKAPDTIHLRGESPEATSRAVQGARDSNDVKKEPEDDTKNKSKK